MCEPAPSNRVVTGCQACTRPDRAERVRAMNRSTTNTDDTAIPMTNHDEPVTDVAATEEGQAECSLQLALRSPDFLRELADWSQGLRVDPEEVVAEILARLCDPAIGGKYRADKGLPIQFAIGIGRRVTQEVSRRNRRHISLTESDMHAQVNQPGPLEHLLTHEQAEEVRSAVATLPARDRNLVLRRFSLGAEERAPMTGSERCRLSRVLSMLQESLSQLM